MRKITLLLALLITSGCSAIESVKTANTQNLVIQTPNVEDAQCALSDRAGRKWRVRNTPGTVAVLEGHPPLVILCTKKGFKTSILTINEQKEEILTIDGKRIDLSIYGDFPTRFPRLIPAAIKEVAGFAQDPTGSISTKYPNEITIWMEPKVWESEDQMRQWALDRQIHDRAEFISEEDAKLSNQQRKEKRRADEKARKDYINKVKKRLQDGGKKGVKNTLKVLNPKPALDAVLEQGRKTIDTEQGVSRSRKAVGEVGNKAQDAVDAASPGSTIDFLNHRNNVKEKVRQFRQDENSKSNRNYDDKSADYDRKVMGHDAAEVPFGRQPSKNIPVYRDDSMPEDLYDNSGDAANEFFSQDGKIKYDSNGKRIK